MFAAFPATQQVTLLSFVRLERSRNTSLHTRGQTLRHPEMGHRLYDFLFLHAYSSRYFLENVHPSVCLFVLEHVFSSIKPRLLSPFSFLFFPFQLRTIPAPRGGFSDFFVCWRM